MKKTFDTNKYKVYTWKHWMILHYILNPGLVFNELVMKQRLLQVMLEDKTSDKPRMERCYVPSLHCNKLHDGEIGRPIAVPVLKIGSASIAPIVAELFPV